MSAQPATAKPKRRKRGIHMRVVKGALIPADLMSLAALRRKKLKTDSVVLVDVHQLRNPRFNRLVHKLGQLCVTNLDAFSHLDAHGAIKKVQMEADICCEQYGVSANHLWTMVSDWIVGEVGELVRPALVLIGQMIRGKTIPARVPQSIAFSEMPEDEFHQLYTRMCDHIAATYWPDLDAEKVAALAELMPEETP